MTLNLAAYHFVAIDDAPALAERLRQRAEADALLGTMLVAEEGINLFLAGVETSLRDFVDWLRADPRFAGMQVKYSHSRRAPFDKLKVKRKREIIAFRRPDAAPLGAGGRAPSVTPQQLARWLDQGHDDEGRPVRLLDTRNREEVAHGSFADALTLPIDNFVDFPAALAARREALDDATVVPFCTGGIRCEKAARWMQANGFDHVRQLDGGILGYFEAVGGAHYDGRCFVFDQRVALDPALRPLCDDAA
ncbi:MAG: sulfurtransferase [Lysobacteraceae bacterium]